MHHQMTALVTKVAVLSALVLGVAFSQPVGAEVIDGKGIEADKLHLAEGMFRGYELDNDIRRGYRLPEFDEARGYGLLLVFVTAAPANAKYDGPGQFMQDLGDRAIAILKRKDEASFAELESEFRELLVEGFDMKAMSRLVLGRHIRTLSEQELDSFEKLFRNFLVRVYAIRFGHYEGDSFEVSRVFDNGDGDVIVRSKIVLTGTRPPVRVDWRLRPSSNDYKIIDVYIEGVSMLNTQRIEFASVIERGGASALFDALRRRVDAPITDLILS